METEDLKRSIHGENTRLLKRIRRHVIGRERDYFAITQPGFEAICREELVDVGLDASEMDLVNGGVLFKGRLVDCTMANLHLRCAGRILMRIADFKATHFRKLEKCLSQIPWELFLYSRCRPKIHVTTHKSRLYHKDAIAGRVKTSIQNRLFEAGMEGPERYNQRIDLRVVHDLFQISLDSSGENLYRRGIMSKGAKAPVRETMATLILKVAGYRTGKPLIDPMCGSGTFSIEAAMAAKNIPPGMFRDFSFMNWPAFNGVQWSFLKRDARFKIARADGPSVFASDRDKTECHQLERMIEENAMDDVIRVGCIDFFDLKPEILTRDKGLVVLNPPYGLRIGEKQQSRLLYKKIMAHLKTHYKGWKIAVMAPDRNLFGKIPLNSAVHRVFHGGLKIWVLTGKIP